MRRAPRRAIALFTVATLVGCRAATPTPQPPQKVTPDIRHYDLEITPDFTAGMLGVRARLALDNPARQDSLVFGLADWYTEMRVRSAASPARVDRGRGQVVVRLDRPQPSDTLVFELAGRPGRCGDEDRAVMTPGGLFLLWSDRFYPVDFGDWATVRTTLTLPRGYEAFAPGRRVRVEPGREGMRHIFETTQPARKFSVLADARWIRSEREVNGLQFETLLYPESQSYRERLFSTSADVIAFYTALLGPYAFDRFTFATMDSLFARRALSGGVVYSPAYLEREMARTGHDAHETALLWWGYTSGGRGPGSFQWIEGLGDYVEILYDEARGKAIPAIFDRFRSEYLATPPAEEPLWRELRGNTPQKFVHGKYPWLMHVLRYVVGDSAFRAGLRSLFDRYRFQTFDLDEMVAALEAGTGQPLGWWRDEWLERRGVPVLALRSTVTPAGPGYRVACSVSQLGEIYHLPLEIGIETSTGMQVEQVRLEAQRLDIEIPVSALPRRVVLDPNGWLLWRSPPP